MRSTVIWSFFGLVTLATGGLLSGCDGDAKITKSAEGESCDTTADCNEGLKCLQGGCYKSFTGGGNEGGEGNGTGGSISGPPAPVLSGDGESCTRRADCEDGLSCFNQRCVESIGMGGGGPGPGVQLGGPGETCGLSSDCEDGLACLPQSEPILDASVLARSNGIGVCTQVNSGLTPTGNTCGHECVEAQDCCELPIEYHQANETVAFGTGANSCAQLADLLTGVNCGAASLTAVNAARCFAQATFCECGENTWSCADGMCVYEESCTIGETDLPAQPGGCPERSRTGRILTATCNADTETCTPVAAEGCTNDASCEGELVADSGQTDTCVADECTCYKATSQCYRACNANLDCAFGYMCDDDTHVCVLAPTCTEDAECIVRYGDFRYQCVEGACAVPCDNDLDCNPNGLINGALTAVCSDNQCQPLGCTTNEECPAAGGVKTFCAPPPEVAVGQTVASAITD